MVRIYIAPFKNFLILYEAKYIYTKYIYLLREEKKKNNNRLVSVSADTPGCSTSTEEVLASSYGHEELVPQTQGEHRNSYRRNCHRKKQRSEIELFFKSEII